MTLDFGALFRRSFDPNDDAAALAVHRFFGGLIESLVAIIYCADVVPTLRKNLKNFLHPRQLQNIQDHYGGGGGGGGGGDDDDDDDDVVVVATDDVFSSDDDENARGTLSKLIQISRSKTKRGEKKPTC